MSGPAPSAEDRIGTTLGSYRITALLGEGTMGEVFLAEHRKLGRVVALKRLRDRQARRREAVQRFIDEAWAVNYIAHPNIVAITDLVADDDGVYCIMEHLEGEPLAETLAREGALAPEVALKLARQAADALAAAHAKGVVHRDVKPSNLFLESPPGPPGAPREAVAARARLKVLDFGIALLNAEDRTAGAATHEGGGGSSSSGLMTPAYMSPEQADGREVDARSDVYSLGAVLFELLTGSPPFRASSFVEYVYLHTSEPAPRISSVAGQRFHAELEALVARCLEKDPAARFADGAALRDALDALPTRARGVPRRRPARWPLLVGGLGAAATAAALIGVSLGRRDEGRTPQGSAPSRPVGRDAGRAATPAASDAAAPRPVRIRIETTPEGAEVRRVAPAPKLLGLTPLTVRVPPESTPWRLALRLAGYAERQLELTPDRAQEHRLVLHRSGASDPLPTPPRADAAAPGPLRRSPPGTRPEPRPPATRDAPGVIDPFAPMARARP